MHKDVISEQRNQSIKEQILMSLIFTNKRIITKILRVSFKYFIQKCTKIHK